MVRRPFVTVKLPLTRQEAGVVLYGEVEWSVDLRLRLMGHFNSHEISLSMEVEAKHPSPEVICAFLLGEQLAQKEVSERYLRHVRWNVAIVVTMRAPSTKLDSFLVEWRRTFLSRQMIGFAEAIGLLPPTGTAG